MRRSAALLSLAFCLSIGCGPKVVGPDLTPALDPRPNPAIADGRVVADGGWHLDPAEVITLMDASPRLYDIKPGGRDLTSFHAWAGGEAPVLEDGLRVVEQGGMRELVSDRPPSAAVDLWAASELAEADGDLASALDLAQRATRVAPEWARGWRHAAELAATVEPASAGLYFVEALRHGPHDAYTWWALADLRASEGDAEGVHEALVRAHVLNPNHPGIAAALDAQLASEGRRLDHQRLDLPFRISRSNQTAAVVVRVGDPTWLPLAQCLAVWGHEVDLQASLPAPELLEVVAFRSCFASQAMGLEALEAAGAPLPPRARRFLGAARAGMLEAVILWDVFGHQAPARIATLPPHTVDLVVEYVERFVVVAE